MSEWSALAAGKVLGKVGYLKVSPTGSPNIASAINANPTGPFEGNGLWTKSITPKNAKGLLIFTDEFSMAVGDLSAISFEQRAGVFSRDPDNNLVLDGAKIAFLVNNRWYISDQEFKTNQKNVWESVQTSLSALTFGSSSYYPGIGPKNPQDSGKALPTGRIVAFGLFYPTVNARVRIDNFTLYDNTATNTATEVNAAALSCNVISASTAGGSYDSNRRCVNGSGDRLIKISSAYNKLMYPGSTTTQLAYLRNKIALRLATKYKQTLGQLASLLVEDFQQRSDGSYEITLADNAVHKLSNSDGKVIQRYITLGKLGTDQMGPLLRPTNHHRLSTLGICGTALRSSLQSRADKLKISKYLRFVVK